MALTKHLSFLSFKAEHAFEGWGGVKKWGGAGFGGRVGRGLEVGWGGVWRWGGAGFGGGVGWGLEVG